MKISVSSLFSPEPIQWGLRGDPYLWREMAEHFRDVERPQSSAELSAMLEEMFFKLTGFPVSYPRHFRIDRHAHGGMSSGGIATEFWRKTAFPLLLSRFKAQQALAADARKPSRG
jgi:hypothetical protein